MLVKVRASPVPAGRSTGHLSRQEAGEGWPSRGPGAQKEEVIKGHPLLDCPCTRCSLCSSSLCLAKVNTTSGPTQRSFSQWPLDSQNRFSLLFFFFLQTPYSVYHYVRTFMPIPLMSFSSSRLFGGSQVVHISRTSSNWTREGFLVVT